MSEYAESIEWDILNVAVKLNNKNVDQDINKDEYYESRINFKITFITFYGNLKSKLESLTFFIIFRH